MIGTQSCIMADGYPLDERELADWSYGARLPPLVHLAEAMELSLKLNLRGCSGQFQGQLSLCDDPLVDRQVTELSCAKCRKPVV